MCTVLRWNRLVAQINPELRIAFSKAYSCRPGFKFCNADCGEHRFIETRCCGDVADHNGNVVDHAGAPDLMSLKMMESIKAWNEASMIFGDTPIVVQRSPASSSLSI